MQLYLDDLNIKPLRAGVKNFKFGMHTLVLKLLYEQFKVIWSCNHDLYTKVVFFANIWRAIVRMGVRVHKNFNLAL